MIPPPAFAHRLVFPLSLAGDQSHLLLALPVLLVQPHYFPTEPAPVPSHPSAIAPPPDCRRIFSLILSADKRDPRAGSIVPSQKSRLLDNHEGSDINLQIGLPLRLNLHKFYLKRDQAAQLKI